MWEHAAKLQLVFALLPGGLVVVSVFLTTAIGYFEQNTAFLIMLGQVLRATDLPLIVGGDFNLAGDVFGQSGWPEELHPFVGTVAADERPTVTRTHRLVVLTMEGVKRGRPVQRLRRPTRLPRIAPVRRGEF